MFPAGKKKKRISLPPSGTVTTVGKQRSVVGVVVVWVVEFQKRCGAESVDDNNTNNLETGSGGGDTMPSRKVNNGALAVNWTTIPRQAGSK